MRVGRLAIAAIAALSLNGPSALANDATLAWQTAMVALPGAGVLKARDGSAIIGKIKPDDVIVLYMHGCTGFTRATGLDLASLAKEGFVAVAPNSMARAGRRANCDTVAKGDTHGSPNMGGFAEAFAYRQQEIAFTLSVFRKWFPHNKYVLMGHSEGGRAAGTWKGTEFRAVIISGWDCYPNRQEPGVQTPRSVPVMAINARMDDWTPLKHHGRCRRELSDHAVKEIIEPDGNRHWVLDQYRPQIAAFIRNNTR